jgi:hypothetical protein
MRWLHFFALQAKNTEQDLVEARSRQKGRAHQSRPQALTSGIDTVTALHQQKLVSRYQRPGLEKVD